MYHGLIFSGSDNLHIRSIGSYRVRSVCAEFGYKIKVIDFCQYLVPPLNTSSRALFKLIDRYITKDTLFYGISTTFLSNKVREALLSDEVIDYIKSKNDRIQIILGGARVRPGTKYDNIDWAVTGYADVSIVKILDFISDRTSDLKYDINEFNLKIVESNSYYNNINTDDLRTVWLKEDFIQSHEALPIEISRGCIFKCSFCAYPLNGKKKFDYIRQPENFSEELAYNYSMFGTTNYMFMDDTFNDSDFKLRRINDAIINSGVNIKFSGYIKPELLVTWPEHWSLLIEMGLQGCSLGIESFYPKTRTAIGKGMNLEKIMDAIHEMRKKSNYSLGTQTGMIIGAPFEPLSSIEESYNWLKNNNHIINTVNWEPLSILNPKANVYLSLIDKDPAKFGYSILGVKDTYLLAWKNEHFTYKSACHLAEQYISNTRSWAKVGGWQPGVYRLVKNIDVDSALKNNTPRKDLNNITMDDGRIMTWEYAVKEFIYEYFKFQLLI